MAGSGWNGIGRIKVHQASIRLDFWLAPQPSLLASLRLLLTLRLMPWLGLTGAEFTKFGSTPGLGLTSAESKFGFMPKLGLTVAESKFGCLPR